MSKATSDVRMQDGTLVPVGTIYCIGRNYAEHAKELGNAVPSEPVVFMKAAATLRPMASGPLAFADETFHHEAEVVFLVGRDIALGGTGDARDIAAAGLGLDLTRREVQSALKAKGLPWTTAKSFAGAAVVTDFVPMSRVADPARIHLSLDVNGERRQQGVTSDMLFPLPRILTFLASLAPLRPGDLIFTGTPPGVGPIRRGDKIRLQSPELGIDQQGVL